MTLDPAAIVLSQAIRLVKSDDDGRPYEIITARVDGASGAVEATVVTPDSDPDAFARLLALERAHAPAE